MKGLAAAVMLTMLAPVAAGCSGGTKVGRGGGARQVVLTLATPDTGDYDVGEFVREVERLSGGSMRIDIRDRWRAHDPHGDRSTVRDVRGGRVDLAKLETRSWHELGVRSFDPLVAPFLIDTYGLENRVLRSGLPRRMLAGVRRDGVVGVAVLPGPLRRWAGITRRFLQASDFAGTTVWTPPSAVAWASYRALGARLYRPEPIGGYDEYLEAFDRSRGDRHAEAMTANLVFWPRAVTIVANKEAFAHLAGEQRAVLEEAGRRAVAPAVERLRTSEAEAIRNLCARGFRFVTATPAELRSFRDGVRPVYAALAGDPVSGRFLRNVEAMKDPSRPGASSPSCRGFTARPGRRGAIPAALLGVWRTSFSPSEFRAAPLAPGETPPPGYTATLTLRANGRFDYAGTVGDYVVHGSRISFEPEGTVEEGGGEVWRFTWSLYRGALSFKRSAEPTPTPFVIKPWRKVG